MTHQLSSPDFHGEEKSEQLTSIGQIKPELYRLRQGDQGNSKQDSCGKISFLLRYAFKWVHSVPSRHYLLSHGEASPMELSHDVDPCLSIHQWVINRSHRQGSQLKASWKKKQGSCSQHKRYSQACRGCMSDRVLYFAVSRGTLEWCKVLMFEKWRKERLFRSWIIYD